MFSNELLIKLFRHRQHLLAQRDPVANDKIIKKIERRIRSLE